MKIYQILLFTLSTVSCIHCSHEPSQNEDSNAAYHIEFEDKSPNGGYGYKVQVSGKSKYQETWKKDKQNIQTEAPTVTESNHLRNNYAASAVTESVIKTNDNIFANNYLTQSQHLNSPAVGTTESSVQYTHPQNNNTPSSSYRSKQTNKNSYSSLNSFGSTQQQINSIPSSSYQSEQISKNPYSSLNSVGLFHQINDIPSSSYQNEQNTENPYSSLNSFGSTQQQIKDISSPSYQSEKITENPYSSLNSFGTTQEQINDFPSSNYQSDQITKNQYSTLNSFGTTEQQLSDIPSSSYQTEQSSKNPYSSLNSFSSYSQQHYKPELSPQNKFSPQIHESNGQGWQISSKSRFIPSATLPSKSSLQIMDYNHFGSNNGPQVFVESTSGKLNQNQFTNQHELKPQNNLLTETDLSSKYLQNSNILHQNLFQIPPTFRNVNIPTIPVEYYQPSSQSKETNSFKTFAQASQYPSHVPAISLPHSIESQLSQLTINGNDNSVKYPVQYIDPLSQYISNDAASHGVTQKPNESKVQYYAPLPTTHNVVHKTIAPTIQYAPQYQSESVSSYSVPNEKPVSNIENTVYNPYIPVTQYSQIPQVSLTNSDYSQGNVQSQNIGYKQSSNYPNEISPLPTSELDSQSIKYDQNSPSLQGSPSIHIPADYNQLLQQYPIQLSSLAITESQNAYQQSSPLLQLKDSPELSADYNQFLQVSNQYATKPAVESPAKNIQFQSLYTAQQPIASKNVKYQYNQELPSSISQNIAVNPSHSQYISSNSDNPSELANDYSTLGYGQQAFSGGSAANAIPISPYGVYGKDNSQMLYVSGMVYGQGYQGVNSQSVQNLNEYGTTGNLGGLQILNPYKISRRSTDKHQNGKNVNAKKQK